MKKQWMNTREEYTFQIMNHAPPPHTLLINLKVHAITTFFFLITLEILALPTENQMIWMW